MHRKSNQTGNLPQIVLTDADGFAAASHNGPTIVILAIERQDVEQCNIASALERLHVLTDNRQNVLQYRESLVFQVNGYDSDPRELSEIPEVRAYFARLTADWPHWLWFLARDFGCIVLLFALLCRVTIVHSNGKCGTAFANTDEVRETMMRLFDRGNALFDTYGISDDLAGESAESAAAEIFGRMVD